MINITCKECKKYFEQKRKGRGSFCDRVCFYKYARKLWKNNPEILKKMREKRSLNGWMPNGFVPWNKGSKMSQDYCEKISISHRGVALSQQHRESIKKALQGRQNTWQKG